MKTLYDTLGVQPDASAKDIAKAYRNLAKKWHPDVTKSPSATEAFLEIKGAYEILKDESKRRKYDSSFHAFQNQDFLDDFVKYESEARANLRDAILENISFCKKTEKHCNLLFFLSTGSIGLGIQEFVKDSYWKGAGYTLFGTVAIAGISFFKSKIERGRKVFERDLEDLSKR